MRKLQNLMKYGTFLWNFLVTSNQSGIFFHIFVAFSEYLIFIKFYLPICFIIIFLFSDEYFRDYCGASTRSTIRHSSAKLVRTNYQWYQIRSSGTSLFATQKRPLYHKCQIGNCYFPLIFVQVKNYFSVITGNFAWLLFFKRNRNFLPTYKPSYKVLSHDLSTKKNGTLLSVIYVILLIILIVKDVNQNFVNIL